MADQSRGFCSRCDQHVDVEYRHAAGTRRWLRWYLYLPVVLAPAFPFMASDYVVMLPILMLYMLGIGPVLLIVRDPPQCAACGALVSSAHRPATPA